MGKELALEAAKQSPAVAALLAVVFLFLSHLERRDEAWQASSHAASSECHLIQQEAIKAIDRNTDAIMSLAKDKHQ